MAMQGLGRLFNVAASVGGASGTGAVGINLKDSSAVTFVCRGADTYTITCASTLSGSYATPGTIINHYYQATASDGSVAWTRQPQTASNAVVQGNAGATTVITVLAPSLPDGKVYVKCQVTGSTGVVTAVTHDLNVMRKPANMPILSA